MQSRRIQHRQRLAPLHGDISARSHYKTASACNRKPSGLLHRLFCDRAIRRQERETAAGHIMHLANSNRPMGNIMRNFSAMTIMAMLASATLVNSAFCASARWLKNTVGGTAVPIWMVGQGSVARRLGSWRLGAPRPSVGLPLAGVAKPTGPPATSKPWSGCATSAYAMAGDRDGVLVRRARTGRTR